MTKAANILATRSTDGTLIAASPGQRFRIMYIQGTANNNNAAADGIVVVTATINGSTLDLFDLKVPIGANTFVSSIATNCDIICDTNTAITIASFGTIPFNIQMAGVYE